ncbi:uridine diphosphate-N-acetylglucosamine-binding protein YvcK [Patescibacteria group bacterium]
MKKVVSIGGGTGSYTILTGLIDKNLDLTSVITCADSGGSTGRLRDEFGHLPVGDFRMALVALADTNGDNDVLRELFLYRFEKGSGLAGHNFGNLLLTALTDIFKSEEKAFEYASKILRVGGKVLPITNEPVTLIAEYEGGKIIIGEKHIEEPHKSHDMKKRIVNLTVQPKVRIAKKTKEAILNADLIVLGPGDLYTSTMANLAVSGVSSNIRKSNAKVVFVVSLMNKYGQTYDFKMSDYVAEIYKYLGAYPDYVLVNTAPMPKDILRRYKEEKGFPPEDDLKETKKYEVIRAKLLAGEAVKRKTGDIVKRSLIRHDSKKLASVLVKLL